MTTNALQLIQPTDERVTAIDTIAKSCNLTKLNAENPFSNSIVVANAMAQISAALTPEMMSPIMFLQGSKIGFKTDKVYNVEEVRNCLIEATLRGVRPIGNEFNIIAGQCYVTKEGFGRLLREISGLRYSITPLIPTMKSDREAIAKVVIEWVYNGEKDRREIEFSIRVNSGMGADAITGKATRKARAWLYNYLTDMEIGDGDAEEIQQQPINVTPGRFSGRGRRAKVQTVVGEGEAVEAAQTPVNAAGIIEDDSLDKPAEIVELENALSGSGLTVENVIAYCEAQKWNFDAGRFAKHIHSMPGIIEKIKEFVTASK